MTSVRPITISINALGGQGGGVLAEWIVEMAEAEGYIAQSTSIPGVAQRTGATVYCVELFPKAMAEEAGKEPVLALMPVPGDVDIVIASEWMEAGRAIQRGFVTPNETTLIASTHRDYTISEKSAMGDGIADADIIAENAKKYARRLIAFDMDSAARSAGSVISSVLFGGLAGAGALPFPREAYEDVIRHGGRMVEENLKGFARGYAAASGAEIEMYGDEPEAQRAGARGGENLVRTLRRDFPHQVQDMLLEGARRLADYQDRKYVVEYADRLKPILSADHKDLQYRLTREVARHLALWMSYEDTVRVADLKTRASRTERVRDEVRAAPGQIIYTREFMHPRLEEIRDMLPRPIGALVGRMTFLNGLFRRGRKISTMKLSGFLMLRMVAAFRPTRRWSYRHRHEMLAIDTWLNRIATLAEVNYDLAMEITKCQGLIKGYGDTHERGMRSFNAIMETVDKLGDGNNVADQVRALRKAALADESGKVLAMELEKINSHSAAA